jgi:hypothetical protein
MGVVNLSPLMKLNRGVRLQVVGALLASVGMGLWLGLAALLIALGLTALVAGTISEATAEGGEEWASADSLSEH